MEAGRLAGRPNDWVVSRVTGRVAGWMAGWVTGWVAGWAAGWAAGRVGGRLATPFLRRRNRRSPRGPPSVRYSLVGCPVDRPNEGVVSSVLIDGSVWIRPEYPPSPTFPISYLRVVAHSVVEEPEFPARSTVLPRVLGPTRGRPGCISGATFGGRTELYDHWRRTIFPFLPNCISYLKSPLSLV